MPIWIGRKREKEGKQEWGDGEETGGKLELKDGEDVRGDCLLNGVTLAIHGCDYLHWI